MVCISCKGVKETRVSLPVSYKDHGLTRVGFTELFAKLVYTKEIIYTKCSKSYSTYSFITFLTYTRQSRWLVIENEKETNYLKPYKLYAEILVYS